jgi:antitoxin (DNA-binding transcriptional repressor) of toxin-antitoxin stability system
MALTATDLRKNLFQVLDRALQGEAVEVVYKGSKLRLVPTPGGSKLARAVRRHSLLVQPESIVESDAGLMAELEKKWKRDDRNLDKNAL